MEHECLRLSHEEERLLDDIAAHLQDDPDPLTVTERRTAARRLVAGASAVLAGAPMTVGLLPIAVAAAFVGYLVMLLGAILLADTVVELERRRRFGLGNWWRQIDWRRSSRP
ncbi:DUF3040 domain-containing protein [Rhabdothermincola sediminis]|uniref:DUF3040 domain-containing protein n=1 Tax=Rhabdothermincola sediminis TaxID=2751370 RepID=UPI001AA0497B|nr:DUF3040 domain-containing protein [Rhabdothermincola sediminis]